MPRYHINPKTGNPNKCLAKTKCPFGGESDHYCSKEQARQAFEEQQDPFTRAMHRAAQANPKIAEMEKAVAWKKNKLKQLAENYRRRSRTEIQTFPPLTRRSVEDYNQDYQDLSQQLTELQLDAIRQYTGISYKPLNIFLNSEQDYDNWFNRKDLIEEQKVRLRELTVQLDQAIGRAPQRPRRLYRRIDQDTTQKFLSSEEWAQAKGFAPGACLSFPSYLSTTIDPEHIGNTIYDDEHTSIVLVFNSDRGAPLNFLSSDRSESVSIQDREREILYPRGGEFRVESIDRASYPSSEGEQQVLTVFLTEIEGE